MDLDPLWTSGDRAAQLAELRLLGDVAVSLTVVAAVTGMHRYSVTRLEGQARFPERVGTRSRPFYRASDLLQWLTGSWGQPARRTFLKSHRTHRRSA